MTWPVGDAPFAVDDLIAAGRACNQPGGDRAKACEVVDALTAYVASLPPEQQQAAARRLTAALAERARFEPSVAPRPTGKTNRAVGRVAPPPEDLR